ncbi:MAG: ATP-binding protein, partial [Verrucomicrobiota bacterium]
MTENKKTNSELNSGFHLDVDAQVVRQLGAELITDAEQALLELVKNAYDADAKWCNLVIESGSEHKIQVPGTDTEVNLVGRICVEDAGSGMDKKALQDGWLTISLSPKRSMKEKGEVTPIFHRTPLGDKGLGRLGTMKLGDYLRITTHHDEDKKGYQIALLWSQCQSGRPLTQVPLSIEEIPKSGKKGTKIEIFGLSDPAYWSGEDRMNKLRYRLSTLVSPFKTFSNFTIGLTLNNGNVDLINFSDRLLNTATAQFECTWDDSELEMSGWVKMGLFEGKRREEFERYVLSDDGKSLFEFLDARNFSSGINL